MTKARSKLTNLPSNWDKYYSKLKRTPKRLKKVAQFVVEAVPFLKKDEVRKVLDLGCGAGRHSILLASSGFEVIGLDTSKSALAMARKWVEKESIENVALVCAAMTNVPMRDGCLDAVVSVSVMHHAVKKDIVTSVNEVYRVLRKNGSFIANLASVDDPRYRTGRMLEKNTFLIMEGYEKNKFEELHHFFTKDELLGLLTRFRTIDVVRLEDKPNYWKITAKK